MTVINPCFLELYSTLEKTKKVTAVGNSTVDSVSVAKQIKQCMVIMDGFFFQPFIPECRLQFTHCHTHSD